MGESGGLAGRSTRCIALVGPYLSGKTTLLEAFLARTGAINRQGSIAAGNSVGDNSPEARAHAMSIEPNLAEVSFLGDKFIFIDCPGSIEFQFQMQSALTVCDAAVVVCEADEKKIPALQLTLKQLTDRGIPHFLFLNKIDKLELPIRDILPMIQPASTLPLVLRQIPIRKDGICTGFVDLALERAFVYREHAPSEVMAIPADLTEREAEARFSMLEKLADYDDELMEALLGDIEPPRDRVFDDLRQELKEGKICPVLLGCAERGNGVTRLLKALRHEAPFADATARRLGVGGQASCAHVFKTYHTAHAGKLSLMRIFSGAFGDGTMVAGSRGEERAAGVFTLHGQEPRKCGAGQAGDVIALGRLEGVATGETLTAGKSAMPQIDAPKPPHPVYGLALAAAERKDEVKLAASLHKLIDEDPSLSLVHNKETGEMVFWGQGEMHLRIALKQLQRRFGVAAETRQRQIPYKESIRQDIEIRGRHKKQSGGHGQFGDVVIEIRPLPRGSGFAFTEQIAGGSVPRQYIPSVEIGVRDFLTSGPLGFPVVDVAVCLKDGSYHTVDSSDMAFRAAGRLAMAEGMPKCAPVLLEPIMAVKIAVPSESTARINGIVSARRGQILGFDARPGWPGWDLVHAHIPDAEMQDVIIELRSATAGSASFTSEFDHLAELTGKLADQVLAHNSVAA
ncbi:MULTISPECIES: elongation factor G [Rhodomicrobium]|uniref:elongation factor G n=1 Tax=Rhodomicrobium TaxID=1068 RepID=UPI000B4ADAE9|nr:MULTISPECIES: elongation factor G [Rhodomicrobium]